MDTTTLTLTIIAAVGIFTIAGAIVAMWYYVRRISIEKQRSATIERFDDARLSIMQEQLHKTEVYYDQRVAFVKEQLEIEKAKLGVEKAKLSAERQKVELERLKLAARNGKPQVPERP